MTERYNSPRDEKWDVLNDVELLTIENRLRVSKQEIRLPDGREIRDYIQIRTTSFVNVLAMTPDSEIICERQYKHGVGRTILTLVAGGIERNEHPEDAAKRELLEETGYASEEWLLLAQTVTHANAGGSTFYSFLAQDCRKVAEPQSGDLETIGIELRPMQDVLSSLLEGNSPVAADATTLLHALLLLGPPPHTRLKNNFR